MNQLDLKGRVAIVTGGARGIGYAVAERVLQSGGAVSLWDSDAQKLEEARTVLSAHREVCLNIVELTQEEAVQAATEATLARFGRIDILINNAAIAGAWPIEEMDVDQARAVVDTNVFGALLGAKNVVPAMRAAGKGVIVNLSSLTGVIGMNGLSAYSASKWAVRGLTRSLALELGPVGIRVCALIPGGVNTPMNNDGTATVEQLNKGYRHVPLQRIGEAMEVARASLFLASDDASYITGCELTVDGGDSAGYFQPGLPGAPAGFVLGGIG